MPTHSRRTAVLALWLVLLFRLVVESESFSSAARHLSYPKNRGGRPPAAAAAAAEPKNSHMDENDSQSFPLRSKKVVESFSVVYENILSRQRSRKEWQENVEMYFSVIAFSSLLENMLTKQRSREERNETFRFMSSSILGPLQINAIFWCQGIRRAQQHCYFLGLDVC